MHMSVACRSKAATMGVSVAMATGGHCQSHQHGDLGCVGVGGGCQARQQEHVEDGEGTDAGGHLPSTEAIFFSTPIL